MPETQPSRQPEGDRFLVSARKYRPQTFGELVAQEHVAVTLQNAVRLDRLHHAYLFSGPRGVGKTTAARLLAKAINCQTPLGQRAGAEPCRACEACRSFEQGRDLNVIEMDAASNNSVNDIRELRETVRIPPQGARKKVYILDEVHMLSTAAFNAFLKTLEEPPEHALFIFATTEPHKVLPTILSRCQRFDFRRIPAEVAVAYLRGVAEKEGIAADEGSLHLIARRADGALRDALSLFDQAVALCGRALTYDELARQLGVVDRDLFFAVTEAARARHSGRLLELVAQVVDRGYDLSEFATGLIEHLRHLYVVATTGSVDLIEADAATRARYGEAGGDWTEADLLRAMLVVEGAEQRLRTSPQPRLALELALLRLAHLEPVADLQELIGELRGLEARLKTSEPAPAAGDGGSIERPAVGTAEPAPPYEGGAARQGKPPPPPDAPPPGPSDAGGPAPPPRRPAPTSGGDAGRPVQEALAQLHGEPALKRPPRARQASGDPPGPQATAVLDQVPGALLDRLRAEWPHVVRAAQDLSPRLGGVLAHSEATGTRAGSVILTAPNTFARDVLRQEETLLKDVLRRALGEEPPPYVLELRAHALETEADEDPFETVRRLRAEHPTLRVLFERFGAEIVWR